MVKKLVFIISISCIGLGCLFGVNASLFQRNNEMTPFTSKETNLPIDQSNCWSRGSVPEWVTQYSFEQPKHSFRSIEGNEILLHSSIQIDIESEELKDREELEGTLADGFEEE